MRTPATVALDRAGIVYTVTSYELAQGEDGYGDTVVRALGLDPDATGKTLVAKLDDRTPVLAVVPVSRMLDLKALARAAGAKRASMAEIDDAQRFTGSVVGAIAPIGSRRRLPVYLDDTLTRGEHLHVSAGRRGAELTMAPADLVAVAAATVAPIATVSEEDR